MSKQRLEAFTDGVIAVIITIMVLDMKAPQGADFAALRSGLPVFLAYALSFANVGIFWNNHHHMLHVTERINGMVLWANLFFLFWMSLVPFVIRWMDDTHFASSPTAAYGVVLVLCSIAYRSARASDHQMQRPKLKAGSRRRQRSERQDVALDLRVGDSVGLCAPVDCNCVVCCDRNDMVHSRSAH